MFHYILFFFFIIFLYYDRKCNYCGYEHFSSKKIPIKDLLTSKNEKQLKILNDTLTTYTRHYVTNNIYNVFKDLKVNITDIEVNNSSLKLNDKSNAGKIYFTYSFTGNPKNTVYNGKLSIPYRGNIEKFDLTINKTDINGSNDNAKNDFHNKPDNKKLVDRFIKAQKDKK